MTGMHSTGRDLAQGQSVMRRDVTMAENQVNL